MSPAPVLEHDLSCIRCRYNLRGLHLRGRCPECGTSIRSTLADLANRARRSKAARERFGQIQAEFYVDGPETRIPTILLASAAAIATLRALVWQSAGWINPVIVPAVDLAAFMGGLTLATRLGFVPLPALATAALIALASCAVSTAIVPFVSFDALSRAWLMSLVGYYLLSTALALAQLRVHLLDIGVVLKLVITARCLAIIPILLLIRV